LSSLVVLLRLLLLLLLLLLPPAQASDPASGQVRCQVDWRVLLLLSSMALPLFKWLPANAHCWPLRSWTLMWLLGCCTGRPCALSAQRCT
jgi:hypothetical protein